MESLAHGEVGAVIPISELRSFIKRNRVAVTFPAGGIISATELERFISFYELPCT